MSDSDTRIMTMKSLALHITSDEQNYLFVTTSYNAPAHSRAKATSLEAERLHWNFNSLSSHVI